MRSYLIVGQTGVGKSSFINAVLGTEDARSSPFEAGTKVVEYFTYKTAFGDVNLIDTPGLGEGSIDLDIAYLSLVREAIALHPIDALIYVTRLDDTRFRPGEKRALQLITQQLGSSIWQNSWLLLTNAALVPQERLEKTVKERFDQICLFLQETVRALDVENSQCKPFQKVLVIDNLTSGWHNNALPISSSMSPYLTFGTPKKGFKQMGDVRPKLAETLRKAVEQLRRIPVPGEYVMQMENLIKQLDDTCVVAVVGRVKAGKSTFINALLGADLAPIGVTETTATINYFRWGQPDSPDFPVRCKWRDRGVLEPQSRTFLESLQGNDSETLHRAEEIEYLEYLLPHPFLQQVTLVDTPGTESAVDDHQNVTADYMRLFGQLRSQHELATRRLDSSADAVIYLIGNVSHTTDQKILQEFAMLTGGRSQATNAIGVMAKIDLQSDFPEGPIARAVKCASQLKNQLNTVVPVSAGLQRALDRLQANNWAGLIRIMETLHRIKSQQLEVLLQSAELFVGDWDSIESPISAMERKELLEAFKWLEWTVFKAIVKEAEAASWNVDTTVEHLTELAGFGPLRSLLQQRFFERGQLIRSYRILNDAFKIVDEIRHRYVSMLREKDTEEKVRLTRFLAFLQQASTIGIGNVNVRGELGEFIRTHSVTNHAAQAKTVLKQIDRDLSRLYHGYALNAVPEDLEALQLLDNNPSLFSGPEVEELRTLFGRNGTEIAHRLQLEHMSAESIHRRSRYWRSVSSQEKPPISVIAERATFRYEHLLNEIRMRPQLPEQQSSDMGS